MGKFVLAIVLLLLAQISAAQVTQNLQIIQSGQELQFRIEIQNSEKTATDFVLFNEAQGFQSEGFTVARDQTGSLKLNLRAGQNGWVRYKTVFNRDQSLFLTEEVAWHPLLQSDSIQQVFSVQAKTDAGIEVISSATGRPQDSLALVVGAFQTYESKNHKIKVFLKTADSELAKTLLDHLERYMAQYEKMLAPYPYDQFSVVECPDEIGFAFPKMTWIGSQLLRFPFILTTSLPHELLHSWWGNGVFVDYKKGNWCEGLTVFGADYGLLDSEGKKLYRIKTINAYLDYVQKGQDIALADFVARGDDPALQAIGYGKALMVFVMLEQEVGAENFQRALKSFYEKFQYQFASWDDFFDVLSEVSHQDLQDFKNFWIHSKGLVGKDFLRASKDSSQALQWTGHAEELQKIKGQTVRARLFSKSGDVQEMGIAVNRDGKLKSQTSKQKLSSESYVVDPEFLIFRELTDVEKPKTFSGTFMAPGFQLVASNSTWADAIQNQFKNKTILKVGAADLDFQKSERILISFDEAWKNDFIQSKLKEKGIGYGAHRVLLENKEFDLSQVGLFLNVQVGHSIVTVFNFGESATPERWLQRWNYYSSESYVVLLVKGAALQGAWIDEDRKSL